MILNGKFVGKEHIIKKIYDLSTFQIDESIVHDLMWDLMSLVLIPNSFLDAVAYIDIEDQKGVLPANFYNLVDGMVREYYSKIPLRPSTNKFHSENITETRIPPNTVIYTESIGTTTDQGGDSEDTVLVNSAALQEQDSSYTYKISDKHIFVNFTSGKIEMAYKAFPIDEKGFPLIPDDVNYILAVSWYIIERYALKLKIMGRISRDLYNDLARESYFYTGALQGYAKMLSPDEMENMRQRATMLLAGEENHFTSFKYLNA